MICHVNAFIHKHDHKTFEELCHEHCVKSQLTRVKLKALGNKDSQEQVYYAHPRQAECHNLSHLSRSIMLVQGKQNVITSLIWIFQVLSWCRGLCKTAGRYVSYTAATYQHKQSYDQQDGIVDGWRTVYEVTVIMLNIF